MKKQHFIFFLIISLFLRQIISQACFIYDNSYVLTTSSNKIGNVTENFREFEFVGRQSRGWIGFSLCTNKTIENSISIIFYFPNRLIFIKNHSKIESLNNLASYEVIDSLKYKIDTTISFKVKINESLLVGKNFITIGHNSNYLPTFNNETMIPKHTSMSEFILFKTNLPSDKYPFCNDNLNIPGRLLGSHWTIYLLSCLLLTIIGFIFIYFRNDQPLKSRFVAPLYCIIGSQMNLIGEFIFSLFPFEQRFFHLIFNHF